MSPDKHVERAEKLLIASEDAVADYQIGFALRAMAHLKAAEVIESRGTHDREASSDGSH